MSHSYGESHAMATELCPNTQTSVQILFLNIGQNMRSKVPSRLWASVSLAVNGGGAALPASQI